MHVTLGQFSCAKRRTVRHTVMCLCLQAQREQVSGERSLLAQLAAGTPMYLDPSSGSGGGFLVPRAWLAGWREFVAGASKRAAGAAPAVPPRPLALAMEETMCSCHTGSERGISFPPPSVTQKYVICCIETYHMPASKVLRVQSSAPTFSLALEIGQEGVMRFGGKSGRTYRLRLHLLGGRVSQSRTARTCLCTCLLATLLSSAGAASGWPRTLTATFGRSCRRRTGGTSWRCMAARAMSGVVRQGKIIVSLLFYP